MKPEDVPDEWVEAAAIARHEYRRRMSPLAISLGWYDLDPEDQAWMLSEARHALAAVAPLIAAAEREACAAIAERGVQDGPCITDFRPHAVATAIRARGGNP